MQTITYDYYIITRNLQTSDNLYDWSFDYLKKVIVWLFWNWSNHKKHTTSLVFVFYKYIPMTKSIPSRDEEDTLFDHTRSTYSQLIHQEPSAAIQMLLFYLHEGNVRLLFFLWS